MDFDCKNCDGELINEFVYCPKCGQKTKLHRLSMHDVLHEAVHYFTHADKGIFQLLRALVVKNGDVAKEYVEGRRKKYFSPLNFFLLVAAIFVFIFSLQATPELTHEPISEVTQLSIPAQQALIRQERGVKVGIFFNHYSNFIAMLALPLTALIFWLFYKKARYNYTEHLVAGMYMTGLFLLCYALIILPVARLLNIPSNYAVLALFLLQILYSTAFYYRFINRKTMSGKAKAFGVSLTATILWGILSGFVVQMYIMSGFWGLLD